MKTIKTFECDFCNALFDKDEHLRTHKRRIHGNGKDMKCQTCNEMFSKPVQVGSHQT